MINSKMIHKRNIVKLCSCIMLGSSLLITACNSDNENIHPTLTNDELNISLQSSGWILVHAENSLTGNIERFYENNPQISLNFNKTKNESKLRFTAGCNTFGTSYNLSGDHILSTDPVIGTTAYCPDLDDTETLLASFFNKDIQSSISWGTGKEELIMKTNDGMVLTWVRNPKKPPSEVNKALLQQLKKHHWQLVESTDEKIQNNLDLAVTVNSSFLNIENTQFNNISYSLGCNEFSGDLDLYNDGILQSRNIAHTKIACSPTLMSAEESLNKLMLKGGNISITQSEKPILLQKINNSANTTIKWQGTKKIFTAKVDGKMLKKNAQGVNEVLKEETKIFSNVTLPDTDFCDGSNLNTYGFLHQQYLNTVEITCDHNKNFNYTYTANMPNMDKIFSYKIVLTETDY